MDLSIVITTYNRKDVVAGLIAALAGQTDPDFEVVVAIDGSTDGTADLLATLRPAFPLRWVDTHCAEYGLAVARNMGILAARGDAVVIVDDDSRPDPGFVAAHKASVTAGVITGGPRHPSNPDTAPRQAWKMAELARLPACTPMAIPDLRRDYPNAYLVENNICLRRADWIDMGLFSERLKIYGYIGQEFFARAEYLGLPYQYNPAAALRHHAELEGDNGLQRSDKMRQIARAELLRPSLLTPRHFTAQIAWAQARAAGQPAPRLPAWWPRLAVDLPLRLARRGLRPLRRALKG